MAIYDKGELMLDLPETIEPWLLNGFRCSSFSYVLVLWFCVCVVAGRTGSKTLALGAAGGQSSLHMLWLHDLQFWSIVSEKPLGISLNRIESF